MDNLKEAVERRFDLNTEEGEGQLIHDVVYTAIQPSNDKLK